ncbi:TIGR03749 family integrating conjugative element protein [Photorhabdus luminescens subsp. sonorensis]|uniref:TIGR03749 family integrating conjugative element protein n=2 Tax=Photorhabdus luminescens TaxID=29488 RepID=A0A5C4RDS3_PHOLU|nr:TIGR03749 family integrating conjugative element protein [Photorhabdus luminescens subsp. sonorensis]
MKKQVLVELLALTALLFSGLVMVSPVEAVELMKWERIPLPVTLHVGQERVVFVDKNVRVGFPSALNGKLRVQSTGGAVYLYPSETFTQTRLQLQDVESGEVILLDVTATNGKGPFEPVRVVYHGDVTTLTDNDQVHYGAKGDNMLAASPSLAGERQAVRRQKLSYTAPLPVVLTRYAAQSLYAPLRTVEAVPGIHPVSLALSSRLTTLYPSAPVIVSPLGGWEVDNFTVVALKVRNTHRENVVLDPRRLQGQFISATFQHRWLGPPGTPEDTTTVYLVVKGRPDRAFLPEPVRSKMPMKQQGNPHAN